MLVMCKSVLFATFIVYVFTGSWLWNILLICPPLPPPPPKKKKRGKTKSTGKLPGILSVVNLIINLYVLWSFLHSPTQTPLGLYDTTRNFSHYIRVIDSLISIVTFLGVGVGVELACVKKIIIVLEKKRCTTSYEY